MRRVATSLEGTTESKVAWIPLSQGKFALVDEADFLKLSQWKWCAANRLRPFYAVKGGSRTRQKMHRFIMGVTDPKVLVDHINGDGLDNRRANLRLCGNSQNQMNRRPTSSTGLKGVSAHKYRYRKVYKTKTYSCSYFHIIAKIKTNRIQVKLITRLDTPANRRLAALHYDRAARLLFGEFAWLNFPEITDYSELAPPNKGLLRLLKLKADMESTYQEAA